MSEVANSKLWWKSKTIWVNLMAVVSQVLAGQFGITISPEMTALIFGVINWILRFITKEEVVWS